MNTETIAADLSGLRVYLAGPMSGYENYNHDAFSEATEDLRSRGIKVLSPVELDQEDGFDPSSFDNFDKPDEYATFLSRDIYKIVEEECEAIAVLPGWEKSGGARTEVAFGQALGLPIYQYPTLEEIGAALKNQGEVRIVSPETGGEKTRKKERMGLLPYGVLMKDVAPLYAAGTARYADHNWRKGYAWSLAYDAMQRHFAEWFEGNDYDEETDCHNLAIVVFHALSLLYFAQHHPELDDRPNTLLENDGS